MLEELGEFCTGGVFGVVTNGGREMAGEDLPTEGGHEYEQDEITTLRAGKVDQAGNGGELILELLGVLTFEQHPRDHAGVGVVA